MQGADFGRKCIHRDCPVALQAYISARNARGRGGTRTDSDVLERRISSWVLPDILKEWQDEEAMDQVWNEMTGEWAEIFIRRGQQLSLKNVDVRLAVKQTRLAWMKTCKGLRVKAFHDW